MSNTPDDIKREIERVLFDENFLKKNLREYLAKRFETQIGYGKDYARYGDMFIPMTLKSDPNDTGRS